MNYRSDPGSHQSECSFVWNHPPGLHWVEPWWEGGPCRKPSCWGWGWGGGSVWSQQRLPNGYQLAVDQLQILFQGWGSQTLTCNQWFMAEVYLHYHFQWYSLLHYLWALICSPIRGQEINTSLNPDEYYPEQWLCSPLQYLYSICIRTAVLLKWGGCFESSLASQWWEEVWFYTVCCSPGNCCLKTTAVCLRGFCSNEFPS